MQTDNTSTLKLTLIYALALSILYYPVFFHEYGIIDDFYVYWIRPAYGFHQQFIANFIFGRPLDAIWMAAIDIYAGSVSSQIIFRFISLGFMVATATMLSRHLSVRCGIAHKYSILIVLLIFTLPGYQTFAVWSLTSICSLVALTGFIAATVADKALVKIISSPENLFSLSKKNITIPLRLCLAWVIILLSLYSYPPTTFFYIIFPLSLLLFDQKQSLDIRIRHCIYHMAILGSASLVYMFSVSEILLPWVASTMIGGNSADYYFRPDISLVQKLIALRALEITGLSMWFGSGRGGLVLIFRAALIVSLLIIGYRQFKTLLTSGKTRIYCFLITALFLGFIVGLSIFVSNAVNLASSGHASYTRHTLVFSSAVILIFVRATFDVQSVFGALLKKTIDLGMVVGVIFTMSIAWQNVNRVVERHANEWRTTLDFTKKILEEAPLNGYKVGVQMHDLGPSRLEIEYPTSAYQTHAYLLLFAGFAQNGAFPEDYRTSMETPLVIGNDDGLTMNIKSAAGQSIDIHFVPQKVIFIIENYNITLDYNEAIN
ncbi:hypothetical protein N8000_05690 [Rhodospirillales bacterium]|nr:hypothetical protein [Rhodospirillales bacterium]